MNYLFSNLNIVALFVLIVLSLYFIATNWIFIYKYSILKLWIAKEKKSLDIVLTSGDIPLESSILFNCIHERGNIKKTMLNACKQKAVIKATSGLSTLSILATTSPFIGLFGTVISILNAFAHMGTSGSNSLSVIAPAISEALVATAAGIFVAIFAYAYHQILKRKAFNLMSIIEIQQDIVLSK